MNLIVVLSAIAVFAAVQGELTPEQVKKAELIDEQCIKETGVSLDDLKKLHSGGIVENDKVKAFARCFYDKFGFLKNGEFQTDVAIAVLSATMDASKAAEIVQACNISGFIDASTAFEIFKCTRDRLQ